MIDVTSLLEIRGEDESHVYRVQGKNKKKTKTFLGAVKESGAASAYYAALMRKLQKLLNSAAEQAS